MVAILFNYDGNITELKEQQFTKTTYKTVVDEEGVETLIPIETPINFSFAEVSEMIEGTYLTYADNDDDFDIINDYMDLNGKCEVISGFKKDGKQYSAKLDKNKYTKTKYLKYLKDKYVLDENGEPTTTKIPKDFWQVNNYLCWNNREL